MIMIILDEFDFTVFFKISSIKSLLIRFIVKFIKLTVNHFS